MADPCREKLMNPTDVEEKELTSARKGHLKQINKNKNTGTRQINKTYCTALG